MADDGGGAAMGRKDLTLRQRPDSTTGDLLQPGADDGRHRVSIGERQRLLDPTRYVRRQAHLRSQRRLRAGLEPGAHNEQTRGICGHVGKCAEDAVTAA